MGLGEVPAHLYDIADVPRLASELGVNTMNEIAPYPVEEHLSASWTSPMAHEIARARSEAAECLQQMTH